MIPLVQRSLLMRLTLPSWLGCSCANITPPSVVPTIPSALLVPAQASVHFAPAATTPGISVTVTSFTWLSARMETKRHERVINSVFDFIASTSYSPQLERQEIESFSSLSSTHWI